jgi:hypothetical protein
MGEKMLAQGAWAKGQDRAEPTNGRTAAVGTPALVTSFAQEWEEHIHNLQGSGGQPKEPKLSGMGCVPTLGLGVVTKLNKMQGGRKAAGACITGSCPQARHPCVAHLPSYDHCYLAIPFCTPAEVSGAPWSSSTYPRAAACKNKCSSVEPKPGCCNKPVIQGSQVDCPFRRQ